MARWAPESGNGYEIFSINLDPPGKIEGWESALNHSDVLGRNANTVASARAESVLTEEEYALA
jgi:hypothetical protein